MHRDELLGLLDSWLEASTFDDASFNGLQIEGRAQLQRVVCGVSAHLELFEAALELEADAVIVHHGLFWKPGLTGLQGIHARRVKALLQADVNLYAYHLPLDAHRELGNNAELARVLGVARDLQPFGNYQGKAIGLRGQLARPLTLAQVRAVVQEQVGCPLHVFGEPGRTVQHVALCSGGAADMLQEAAAVGADLYLTGEAAEWTQAISRETGVSFIAAGHHATERFGPRALAARLDALDGVEAQFVDVANPV